MSQRSANSHIGEHKYWLRIGVLVTVAIALLTVFGYSGHQLKTRLDISAGRMRYLLDLDRALSAVSRATVTAQQTTGDRTQALSQVRKSLAGMKAASPLCFPARQLQCDPWRHGLRRLERKP